MSTELQYLEGRKLCVVFCKLVDEDEHGKCTNEEDPKFQIKTMHGRANVIKNEYLECVSSEGGKFKIPPSAYDKIFPNDGTDILKDCEYFVMVKVSGMDLQFIDNGKLRIEN